MYQMYRRNIALFKIWCLVVFAMLFVPAMIPPSHAAHPLITDDTGTQGKGKFQLEINGEYSFDKEKEGGSTIKQHTAEISAALSYGIADAVDLVLGIPYQWIRVKEDGHLVSNGNGISDVSVEAKWRFYEKDGLSLGLKPGITLPTGDDKRGLGTGRIAYSLFFIGSRESEPWAFHLNIGYIRNENKAYERKNIWHASFATMYEALKGMKLVANVGLEKNPVKASDTPPAFLIGGIIYAISEHIDIDFGIKTGLNRPETDCTFLAGMALRF